MSLKDVVNKVLICKLKTTKEVMKYYDEIYFTYNATSVVRLCTSTGHHYTAS